MTDQPAVALYLRSAVQNEDAIAEQLQFCEAHAAAHGWAVGEIFIDNGMSGTCDDRPGIAALWERVSSGRAALVLAVEPSRFFRDPDLLMSFAYFCGEHGTTLAYVESPFGTIADIQRVFFQAPRWRGARRARREIPNDQA